MASPCLPRLAGLLSSPASERGPVTTRFLLRRWRPLLQHAGHLLLPLVLTGAAAVLGLQHRLLLCGRLDLLPAAEGVLAAAARRARPHRRCLLLHASCPSSVGPARIVGAAGRVV